MCMHAADSIPEGLPLLNICPRPRNLSFIEQDSTRWSRLADKVPIGLLLSLPRVTWDPTIIFRAPHNPSFPLKPTGGNSKETRKNDNPTITEEITNKHETKKKGNKRKDHPAITIFSEHPPFGAFAFFGTQTDFSPRLGLKPPTVPGPTTTQNATPKTRTREAKGREGPVRKVQNEGKTGARSGKGK